MRLLTKRLRVKLRDLFDNRTALLILLFGLILFAALLAFVLDAFGVRTAVYRMIYGGGGENEITTGEYGGIPNMTRPVEEDGEGVYFTYSDKTILDELVPKDRYTRAFRIIRQWQGENSMDRYVLTVDGDCWELTGSALTAFCDGEKTYLSSSVYAAETEAGGFEDIVGVTSLSEIAEKARNGDAEISVAEQNVRVVINDPETGLREQYEISMETGIVVSEQSSYNGELYRFVTTEILTDPASSLRDRIGDLRDAFHASRQDLASAGQNDQDGGTP